MTTLFIFSLKFETKFRQKFLGNYLLEMLDMLKHYLLRNAILWNLFLLDFIVVPIGRQLSVKCRFASFFVLNHTRQRNRL